MFRLLENPFLRSKIVTPNASWALRFFPLRLSHFGSSNKRTKNARKISNKQSKRDWSTNLNEENVSCPVNLEEKSKVVHRLSESIKDPRSIDPIPTYRVIDFKGNVISDELPQMDKSMLLKVFESMITIHTMDNIMIDVQRQGRVSFYMSSLGEEAIHFGSATAFELSDIVYPQYRESGVIFWRGFSIEQMMNQMTSNHLDYGKGRQMPMHYGSKAMNFVTVSSPLSTQIPQAVGSAYHLKLQSKPNCCIVYFGEGASSEGDFHPAMNFAATLGAPVLFFCRNNGWAISTPSSEQYRGDGIAGRAAGYGMHAIRVDGNDFFAVHNATKEARRLCVTHKIPVFIEAMTYRVGHHSTSDDYTTYRSKDEVDRFRSVNDPIKRLGGYLRNQGWMDDDTEEFIWKSKRKEVVDCLNRAEETLKPAISELFSDVYDELTPNLVEQKDELKKHMSLYPHEYLIENHVKE